ncbi:MAG: hypothetical protein NT038_00110 [Euryarchaeota archaeon]|nr:hypothetical protein [Euryarchaeota archaeon]
MNLTNTIFILFNVYFLRCFCIIKEGNRYRYIGFIVKSSEKKRYIDRSELFKEIEQRYHHCFHADDKLKGIKLIRFDGSFGIVKCSNTEKKLITDILQSIQNIGSYQIQISTIAASGTIHALLNHPSMKITNRCE